MRHKINLLSYDFIPNDGGISRLTASIARELYSNDKKIEVCTLKQFSNQKFRPIPGLKIKRLNRCKPFRDIGLFFYLLSLPKRNKVIASVWNPEATVAWILGKKELYIMAHGNEVMSYPKGFIYSLKSFLRKKVLSSAECIICNSSYTEKLVHNLVPNSKTKVINPCVDVERFSKEVCKTKAKKRFNLPEDKKIILSVSRIDRYKGHDIVFKAISDLKLDEKSSIHYVIAGNGSYIKDLKNIAEQLNIADSITWLGFVNDDILPELYKASDFFVLCTREDTSSRGVEGFGMVFLEAQASGVPVIGTNAGGISDAIKQDQGGWLIEEDNWLQLKNLISELINKPETLAQQGKKAKMRIKEECSWEIYIKELKNVLEAKV